MALARVVQFEGVSQERIDQLSEQMMSEEGPPPEIPGKEFMLLHDADAGTAVAIIFFDSEDDYRRGDETLSSMPADETPGRRQSVSKYHVAVRRSV
jgi:hypothetical protein